MEFNQLWKRFVETSGPSDLQDLRRDLTFEVSIGTFIIGWLVMVSAFQFAGNPSNLLVTLLLFAGSLGSIWLRNKSVNLALYVLLSGIISAIVCHKWLFLDGWAQFFYPIAVVVVGVLISNVGIFFVAAILSLVCLGMAWALRINLSDPVQVWIPILLIFVTALTSWLSSRQIYNALGKMQSSYRQARQWLEQLRDERVEQLRTIKILEEAYQRIEKLNYMLVEARSTAEEARRLKAEFAANISHELRTPLNLIIGFSETMANAPETYTDVRWSPTLRGDVEEIYRSSSHLMSLIDDILDLSALEVSRLGLILEDADISSVIEDAAAVMRELYHVKRLYLKLNIEPGLPPLLLDATRIRQVLINLLSNASRFTKTGGVTITARSVEGAIQVAVADTGIGIAPQDVGKVFEEFGQVDGSTTRTHEGTGLGVPLSKRLIEMHGGVMWLESKIGIGTTFYFTVPLRQAASNIERAAQGPEISPTPITRPASRVDIRKSILIAEADALLLRTMRRQLSAYNLVEVDQQAHLPELIQKHRPIALIVDQPDRPSGAPQEEWMASIPADLPIIRASFQGSLKIAQELGIQDYLLKPVSREQLLESISNLPKSIHTILIVDDDTQLQELFCRMLESAGGTYRPLKADRGEDALHILHTQTVDLVLLDLLMPGIGGMEILRAMKQDPALAALPVIMISGQYPDGMTFANPLSITLYRAEYSSLTETLNCLQALVGVLPMKGLPLEAGSASSPAPGGPPVS